MSGIFSSRALLALQAVTYIAYHGREGQPIKSSTIITRYRLNKRALEPILQQLARAGLVESKQGANGGYTIPSPATTSLADVVRLFTPAPEKNLIAFDDLRPLLLPPLQAAHADMLKQLEGTTLADVIEQAKSAGISAQNNAAWDFII